jgi:hypothetical protein
MAMFVFAALTVTAVTAIIWGTAAVALRQSQQDQRTMEGTEEAVLESGWSITETGGAPGWYIASDHLRMW